MKTALEWGLAIQSRQVGVAEAVRWMLEDIQKDTTHSFIHVWEEDALLRAQAIQKSVDAGESPSPLFGVPTAIKDNICTKGELTTCASKMLANFRPPYDAAVVEKLYGAGAVMIGKLNLDEFAMGDATQTSLHSPTLNPWDLGRVPGGSSGGTAAAVAAGLVPYALGSDTGGSIRQPAAYCGVTGFKPSYGAVSRYGVVAFASSMDQVGPIARDARDIAAVMDVLCGKDPRDATSTDLLSGGCLSALNGDVRGLRIGILRECFGEGLDDEVKNAVLSAASALAAQGAIVEECSIPLLEASVGVYQILSSAEAASNLSRFDGIKYGYRPDSFTDLNDLYLKSRSEGFGAQVKRRILLGNYVLSADRYEAYYVKAQKVRMRIKQAFDRAFEGFDLLLTPTAPTAAPKLGEGALNEQQRFLGEMYTVAANLSGLPAVSAPCGFDKNALPIGFQLMGKAFSDAVVLNAVHAYQQATDHHKKAPTDRRENTCSTKP